MEKKTECVTIVTWPEWRPIFQINSIYDIIIISIQPIIPNHYLLFYQSIFNSNTRIIKDIPIWYFLTNWPWPSAWKTYSSPTSRNLRYFDSIHTIESIVYRSNIFSTQFSNGPPPIPQCPSDPISKRRSKVTGRDRFDSLSPLVGSR